MLAEAQANLRGLNCQIIADCSNEIATPQLTRRLAFMCKCLSMLSRRPTHVEVV